MARKGNYGQAIDDFAKALEIDSFYVYAYYNSGVTWSDKGDLQQVLADIGKALDLKNPAYRQPVHITKPKSLPIHN